jgi:hypothetical protein
MTHPVVVDVVEVITIMAILPLQAVLCYPLMCIVVS